MAKYKETAHTDKAFALIGKMVAGKISELEFTKIKVSDKDYSKHTAEELKRLTALEQIKQETLVSEKTPVGDNAVNIHGIIYNTDLQNSYYLRTIGLYANDPDEGEILYSVTATEVGDYIPTPNGNNITTAIIDILTEISDAKVNLSGNPSALVDVSMLNKKLDRGEGLEKEFDSAVKIVTELKKKQNKEDSTLKTAVKTIVGAINELFDNKLEKGGYTGTAQNLLTEISKITSKSVLGRIIIGKGLSVDSSGRTSIVSKNDGIIVNENDIQLNVVDNTTTDSGTKPLSARQGKKIEENKQNKNDSALLTTAKNIIGAINELYIELWKTGSTTQFGRFKVGKNLSVDGNGFLNGAAPYTHPSGNGNTHLPNGGASGNFLKWLSAGVGQWANITWSDITGRPSSFPPASHNHKKNEITDFPSSLKNPNALTISLNGTSQGAYDGSSAKNINITAGGIGAYTKGEVDTKFKNFCPFPVDSLYLSLGSENPATTWLGTTWQKQEGRFLLGSSSTYTLGTTGGNSTIKLSVDNLPSHTHSATTASHSHTQPVHKHTLTHTGSDYYTSYGANYIYHTKSVNSYIDGMVNAINSAGGETTGSASPVTTIETTGKGTSFSIMPPYLVVNIWKRTS